MKLLMWDRHGVWLCTRRLHQGAFRWPRDGDTTWSLTAEQFAWLTAALTGCVSLPAPAEVD